MHASGRPSRRKGNSMPRSIRRPHILVAGLAALLCAVLPSTGWTWGSTAHHYIAQHYSQHLPDSLGTLRAYDGEVDAHVTDPDTRKGSTPGESEKHYIDIDYYPEFLAGTLPRSRAALEALYGAATVADEGVLPWAIGEAVGTLTAQFRAQQWDAAALTIADLCHYVGDASHPLHCTVNFDGQRTGNNGIHSRYESDMITTYLGQLDTPAMTAVFCPSALDAAFDLIAASWAGVSPILAADDEARRASSGAYDSYYYASLWSGTHTLTQARLDTASVLTASLVTTAWVNAGRAPLGSGLLAYPSPLGRDRDELTVEYAGGGPLSVEVFDVRGARVARLADGVAGEGVVTWHPGGTHEAVGPGLYFVRLRGPGTNVVRKVMKTSGR